MSIASGTIRDFQVLVDVPDAEPRRAYHSFYSARLHELPRPPDAQERAPAVVASEASSDDDPRQDQQGQSKGK